MNNFKLLISQLIFICIFGDSGPNNQFPGKPQPFPPQPQPFPPQPATDQCCDLQVKIKDLFTPQAFRVKGRATDVLKAEQVLISLTAETLDMQVGLSAKQNADIVAKAIAAIKKLGITDNELSTSGFTVAPTYNSVLNKDTNTYESVLQGYKVRNTIQISTKKLDLTGAIIDRAVQNGVNNIDSVNFSALLSSVSALREKLLVLAVKNAKKLAGLILDELQYQITGIQNINIIEPYQPFVSSAAPSFSFKADVATQTFPTQDRQDIEVEVYFFIEKK